MSGSIDWVKESRRIRAGLVKLPTDWPFHAPATKELGVEFRRIEAQRRSLSNTQHELFQKAREILKLNE